MLGVGIVGAGGWGVKLARAFSRVERAEIRHVCDVSSEARARAISLLPSARVTASFDEAVAEVDAVVIATPPETHATLALSALRAGRHVFLEKPMALSLRDAHEIERVTRESGRRVMIGHILEHHPAVIELRRLISEGELGRVRLVVSQRLGAGARAEESPWWSLAPHDLSAIRYLLETDVARVTAGGSVAARIDTAEGVSALVELSGAAREKVRRLVVAGDERIAVFDDLARDKLRLFDWTSARIDELASRAAEYRPPLGDDLEPLDGFSPEKWLPPGDGSAIRISDREPLVAEAEHFVSAVIDGTRITTDATSGSRVVAALEAGAWSIANGALTVKVSF